MKLAATCRKLEIRKVTFKMAKHALGTTLKKEGFSIGMISDVLGHHEQSTTESYLHRNENDVLDNTLNQFFDRLETQFRQILREGELTLTEAGGRPVNETANLLVTIVEGHVQQYVRTGFRQSPLTGWDQQWQLLTSILKVYA